MNILIKGMEMPIIEMEWTLRHGADGKWYVIDTNAETSDGEWHEIIPIPPHGLIDRERILDSIRIELAQANAVNDMEDYDLWMQFFDYIRKFPTIIPAEPPKEAKEET